MTLDAYVKSIAMLHPGNSCKQQMEEIMKSIANQVETQKIHEIDIEGRTFEGIEAMISSQQGDFIDSKKDDIILGKRKSKALTFVMDKRGDCYLILSTIHSECEKIDNGYDLDNERIYSQSRKMTTIEQYATIAHNFELTYF